MTTVLSRRAALVLTAATLLVATPALAQDFRVLVFSKTSAFRHDSISDGIAMIQAFGAANDFAVDTTEIAGNFSVANLSQYAAVIWLNTSGDVLSSTQETAFRTYVESGGAWVGIHSATDTEYGWPWYGELIGGDAWFDSHPAPQTATIDVEDQTHASTSHWPATVSRFEEWYNFQNNPRSSVNVLVSLDEGTYSGGNMGADHPIAWYHTIGSGRAWYTAMGHHAETYDDPDFRQHVLGGILWAANTATPPASPCAAGPVVGCITAGQGRLYVSEQTPGRESVTVALKKLGAATTQASFGNPVTGTTSVALCLYDQAGALRGELYVSRAGQSCDSTPCWRAMSDKGYKYGDRIASADGVARVQMKAGALDKGRIQAKGANNASQGEASLPLGIAAALASATQATAQIVTSDAACFTTGLTNITTADGVQFKAGTP